MKTWNRLLLVVAAMACALALVIPTTSHAGTTTLLTQNFTGSFPPAGWSVFPANYGTSQPCSYGTTPGWYQTTVNPGSGSTGAAVFWCFGGYGYPCYGTSYG